MTFDSIHIPDHLYFVTAGIVGWKPLFSETGYASIILNSLAWLRQEKRMSLYAFVLMSTHLHAILSPLNRPIGELMQNFGSFTAHKILQNLRKEKRKDLLDFFHAHRRDNSLEHSIWQDIQAKNIYTENFLLQKMEYIHQNPVAKEWNLVQDHAEYPYSSACYYDEGRQPIIEIDDIRDFLFLD